MKRLCMVLCIFGFLSVSHARENKFEQFGNAFNFCLFVCNDCFHSNGRL